MVVPVEVAGLPEGGPATVAGVKLHLELEDTRDDERLTALVAAVNAQLRRWPVAQLAVDLNDWSTAADVVHGANMLAARLFRRRNSPAGVEAFGADGAVYISRNDPDIAQMLQLGSWARPQVG